MTRDEWTDTDEFRLDLLEAMVHAVVAKMAARAASAKAGEAKGFQRFKAASAARKAKAREVTFVTRLRTFAAQLVTMGPDWERQTREFFGRELDTQAVLEESKRTGLDVRTLLKRNLQAHKGAP